MLWENYPVFTYGEMDLMCLMLLSFPFQVHNLEKKKKTTVQFYGFVHDSEIGFNVFYPIRICGRNPWYERCMSTIIIVKLFSFDEKYSIQVRYKLFWSLWWQTDDSRKKNTNC